MKRTYIETKDDKLATLKVTPENEKATVSYLRITFALNENFYAVLFADELTNKEVRLALFNMQDQKRILNYKQEGKCILIWSSPREIEINEIKNKSILIAEMPENNEVQLRQGREGFYMVSLKTGIHYVSEKLLNERVEAHWAGFKFNQNR